MSLFGGPLPPADARDEAPFIRSSPIVPPSSPPPFPTDPVSPIEREASPNNEASDEYTDSDSEDERPRFQGNWWNYRKHIEEERNLAASLAQLRAEDLSLHLYNAHALKKRANAAQAASKDKDDSHVEKPWVPPRLWTAWPLEPSQVPRPYERFAILPTIDPDDEYTVREPGHDKQKPSREMEDIMVGMVLKNAKERFNRRKWEDETDTDAGRARSTSRERSRVESRGKGDGSDTGRRGHGTSASRAATPTDSRPVITTDDDRAYRILKPSIRSTLTKLDELLMALHHSQQNRLNGRARYDGNETETAADTDVPTSRATSRGTSRASKRRKRNHSASEGEMSAKRRRGRPPKPILHTPWAESAPDVEATETEQPETPASPRKRSRGRPRKFPKPLPGESYYMMRKRLDQLGEADQGISSPTRAQTTELETEASRPTTPATTLTAANPARSGADKTSSEDSEIGDPKTPTRRGEKAVQLRGWKEVLGTAAMLGGFEPAVIDRAMRRCVDLFGEGSSLRVLEESTALIQHGELVEYSPETIPPPEATETEDDEEEEEDTNARPAWDGVSLKCPHRNCPRHTEAYDSRWRLREHVKKKHGYKLMSTGEELTETEGEWAVSKAKVNYADLVGAVHNDGFLQPLPRRPGWVPRGSRKDKAAAESITTAPQPVVVSAEPSHQEKDSSAQKKKKKQRAPGF